MPLVGDRKVRVGAVNYLNARPLLYGFEQGMMMDQIELTFNYPGQIAAGLLSGDLDIGLVPVAVLPGMDAFQIISDYGIAADGPVASVAIFAEQPIQQLDQLILDYQSRTSVMLARYLMQHHWKHTPHFEQADADFIGRIQQTTGAVIIGDRALQQLQRFEYVYDLAAAWKDHTGLPFVFAAWVSRVQLADSFILQFNKANEWGLNRLQEVADRHPFSAFDLHQYYTQFIHYRLSESKLNGLRLFLDRVVKPAISLQPQPVNAL